MRKLLFAILTFMVQFAFADYIFIDNSMAAARHSDIEEYEERVSVGPYIEFSNLHPKKNEYRYKVNNRKYDIDISNTNIYGAAGNLPLNNYIGLYVMAGYQFLGINYEDRNLEEGYEIVDSLLQDWIYEGEIDSNDIKGHQQMHTVLFQIGFDFGYPFFSNYDNQFMAKIFGFAGLIAGKTFFQNESRYVAPPQYGYGYGIGLRLAYEKIVLSGGFRNSHKYFQTYYEKKFSRKREGDEFMLNMDSYFQPFINIGIALF